MSLDTLDLKIATEPGEFEQIHRMNYRTFVEEIPQHAGNPERRLVDKFDTENTYLIALHGTELVGMVTARDIRPFSLDQKLPDLDAWLPPHRHVCEIRLLAIQPEWRNRDVLPKLLAFLSAYCRAHDYDLLIMSGTTLQSKLYRRLGFLPFGPLVGSGDVLFQPMYLTLELADAHSRGIIDGLAQRYRR